MMIDPTMSDREQHGLRGPVKSCTRESTRPGVTDADGKTYPEVHLEYTTEYDTDGRVLVTRSPNSDGSQWVTRFAYDTSGRLMTIRESASRNFFLAYNGSNQLISLTDPIGRTVQYSYDGSGRLISCRDLFIARFLFHWWRSTQKSMGNRKRSLYS